jgi:uncharacterized protein (UPF0332 family)
MKQILGKEYHTLADYFDSCRAKRNITDYSRADEISETEAQELIKEANNFLQLVTGWLEANHPSLSDSDSRARR